MDIVGKVGEDKFEDERPGNDFSIDNEEEGEEEMLDD